MTNNNKIKKEEAAWNSPPPAQRQRPETPRNQDIPPRATPPPVQRRRVATTTAHRPQSMRPNNNRNRYNRLVNTIAPSPDNRRSRAILHRYVQNLIAANANASPGSNRSNQTPLKKNNNNKK